MSTGGDERRRRKEEVGRFSRRGGEKKGGEGGEKHELKGSEIKQRLNAVFQRNPEGRSTAAHVDQNGPPT